MRSNKLAVRISRLQSSPKIDFPGDTEDDHSPPFLAAWMVHRLNTRNVGKNFPSVGVKTFGKSSARH
jgi:hypothetical protein